MRLSTLVSLGVLLLTGGAAAETPEPCSPRPIAETIQVDLSAKATLDEAVEWYRSVTCQRVHVASELWSRKLGVTLSGKFPAAEAPSLLKVAAASAGASVGHIGKTVFLEPLVFCRPDAASKLLKKLASSKPGSCELDLGAFGRLQEDVQCVDTKIELRPQAGSGPGLKVGGINEGSLFHALGLRNGDVLAGASGVTLSGNASQQLERQRNSDRISLELFRAEKKVEVNCGLIGKASPAAVELHPLALLARAAERADCAIDPGAVKKVGEGQYEIARSELERLLYSKMNCLAEQARVVPTFKDGVAGGFKIFDIRSGSVYRAMGLEDQDVIKAINRIALTTPEASLEALGALKKVEDVKLEIERRGRVMTVVISVK